MYQAGGTRVCIPPPPRAISAVHSDKDCSALRAGRSGVGAERDNGSPAPVWPPDWLSDPQQADDVVYGQCGKRQRQSWHNKREGWQCWD